MKERPIIMQGESIRAILDGRKTQTRRVIKPQHNHYDIKKYSPYGKPGDRLWVRETWMQETEQGIPTGACIYRATSNPQPDIGDKLKWKPSIHMFRKDSRILLEIVDIRVERVQDITPTDARAEGAEEINKEEVANGHTTAWCGDIVAGFKELWDSINKKRGYGWDVNPWTWVIEFKVKESK